MNNILMKLILSALVLALIACGSGGGSTSSGGDFELDYNLNGTYHVTSVIIPQFIEHRGFTASLVHQGDNVTGTIVSTDQLPSGTDTCDNGTPNSFNGVVANSAFNGVIGTPISTTNFSAFGSSSDSLISTSGTITITSGPCLGSHQVNVTMTRI